MAGLCLTAPRAHAAGPADDAAPVARITVDAAALGDEDGVVADQVAEGAAAILDSNGLVAVDDPQAPEIVLRVSPLPGDNPGYRVAYEVRVDGAQVDGSSSVSDCRLCTESELVETAQAAVEMQLPRVRALQSEPAAPDPDPAADVSGPTEPDNTAATDPRGGADGGPGGGLGPLGKAGIGVGAAGAGALVAGIVLAVLPDKPQPNAMVRTTRLPGIVVAASGGAAVAVGVALLIVDRRRARSRVAVLPSAGRGAAGLTFVGRF